MVVTKVQYAQHQLVCRES